MEEYLPVFITPPEMIMSNFDTDSQIWQSPPFYTHVGGYKMCLVVDANGRDSGKGTHVSISLYMMKGEFVYIYSGLSKGKLQFNQRGGGKHYEMN